MLEDLHWVRIVLIWWDNVLSYLKSANVYLQLALAWQEDWRKVVAFSQWEQQQRRTQLDDEWSAQNSVQCLRSKWFISAPDSNSLSLQRPHLFKTPSFPLDTSSSIAWWDYLVLLTLEIANYRSVQFWKLLFSVRLFCASFCFLVYVHMCQIF